MDVTPFLYLIGTFLFGFIIAWFAGRGGPVYALEKASVEIESLRQKLREAESELRKTQGHLRENLATLDEMAEERKGLAQQFRAVEVELSNAMAEIERLRAALERERDATLLLRAELTHTRGALSAARHASGAHRATLLDKGATEEVPEEQEERLMPAEEPEKGELTGHLAEFEQELSHAAADRLAEKEALVAAELFLRRRTYRDILAGGEDAIIAALADRDRALADAQIQLDSLRRDLGMLTAAGAQLAAALEKRNGEYAALLNRIAAEEAARRLETALPMEMQPTEEALIPADSSDLGDALAARTAELEELRSECERLKAALDQALADREALQQVLNAHVAAESLDVHATAAPAALHHVSIAKQDTLSPQVQTHVTPATTAPVHQIVQTPQALEKVKGIGHVYEQRLYRAGIGTYWQLANLSDEEMERILQVNPLQTLRIDFNAIRSDAERLAQETNTVGQVWSGDMPDDFEPIEGIGKTYARRLYEAGIRTYRDLASMTPERLAAIIKPRPPTQPDFAHWIAQAQQLAEEAGE